MLLHSHPEDRMSLTGVTTFLLLLGLIVTTTSAQSCSDLSNALTAATVNANYNLSVSPTNLTSGTIYTVTLNPPSGTNSNITVLFKAALNNPTNGTWSVPSGFTNCSDGFWGTANSALAANWTSPAALSATNVTFSVVLNISAAVTKLERVITTLPPTTAAPTTSINGTTVKSGGPTHQPMSMFLAVIETLTLLVLTSKLLS